MSSPFPNLVSTCVTIHVTSSDCYISKSDFEAIQPYVANKIQFHKIFDNFGIIPVSPDKYLPTGFSVDICFYYWEDYNKTDESEQRDIRLSRFTENIDSIAGSWLLNQDRLFTLSKGEIPHPIIHIPPRECSDKELQKYFPRYAYIMDDSIWNYLLIQKGSRVQVKEQFLNIIKQIRENAFTNKYYYLNIAYEYAHLKARLVRESYIFNRGEKGNHGAHVSPFLFHSESKMRKNIEDEDIKDKQSAIQKHKWRFLLLDDKHEENLSILINDESIKINKNQILSRRLDHVVGKGNYTLNCVATVGGALEQIKKCRYDIVFIDYLLEEESVGHYGVELLEEIERDCREKPYPQYVGPLGRLFFMFTSAFTTAVSERLILEGLSRSRDYWYIGEGACPTNTPFLFDYYLLNLMWKRLDDSGINDLTASHIYSLLHKIFLPKEKCKDQTSVRKRANENYREILSLQYHYQRLLKDVEMADKIQDTNGSVLVTEFISWQTNLGGLLEHLVQLVHITAFGTVRQWPELWEEYIFCKAQFDDVFDEELNRLKLKEESTKQLEQFIKDCLGKQQLLATTEDASIEQALKLKDELYHDIEQHILNLRAL